MIYCYFLVNTLKILKCYVSLRYCEIKLKTLYISAMFYMQDTVEDDREKQINQDRPCPQSAYSPVRERGGTG